MVQQHKTQMVLIAQATLYSSTNSASSLSYTAQEQETQGNTNGASTLSYTEQQHKQ